MPEIEQVWHVAAPQQFVDKRTRLTRLNGLVTQHVRAYRAVIVRKGERKPIYDRCPHAHIKPSAARKCAERAAARRNKGLANLAALNKLVNQDTEN